MKINIAKFTLMYCLGLGTIALAVYETSLNWFAFSIVLFLLILVSLAFAVEEIL